MLLAEIISWFSITTTQFYCANFLHIADYNTLSVDRFTINWCMSIFGVKFFQKEKLLSSVRSLNNCIQCVFSHDSYSQQTLQFTEYFADGGVMHVRTGFEYGPALVASPDHERVHWSLDMRFIDRHIGGVASPTTTSTTTTGCRYWHCSVNTQTPVSHCSVCVSHS